MKPILIGTTGLKSLIALLVVLASLVSNRSYAVTINPDGFEVGGSNFPLYSITTNEDATSRPLVWRPVVGTLHDDPDRVNAELEVMKSRGQKKIAIVIWHVEDVGTESYDGVVYGLDIASGTGRLAPQQESNLGVLLDDIKQIGFEEVQVRFSPQAGADPTGWTAWNEAFYQDNWNFIVNTRAQVEAALAATSIRRVYDLGLELGGITANQATTYQKRLWSDYSTLHASDSYGFSIGYQVGVPRFTQMIDALRATGAGLPSEYAVDMYQNQQSNLQEVAAELTAQGEISKSLVIQEAPYNDATSYANILAGRNATGLNIRTIMQWPLIAGSGQSFSVDYCPEYRNYNPFPSTGVKGTVIANPAVCTIPTPGTLGLSTISWNTNSTSSGTVKLASGAVFAQGVSGSKDAPWIPTAGVTFNLWIGSTLSDSTAVYALTEKGKLATSSSTNTCTLAPGSSTCTETIYWSVPDTTETITVKLADGRLFAQGGETGQADATWITTAGATFNLYAGSKLLDSIFVYAVH